MSLATAILTRSVPAAGWLKSYEGKWLRADLIAGLTLAAYLLPAGIGDASLAGLPPQAGIYACLFSGLVFWLFCSSRHTAITVTSAISLLIGSSLAGMAAGDISRFAALASCTALMVATIAFIGWLVRAGAVVNFISETVLTGFKASAVLTVSAASRKLSRSLRVAKLTEITTRSFRKRHLFFRRPTGFRRCGRSSRNPRDHQSQNTT